MIEYFYEELCKIIYDLNNIAYTQEIIDINDRLINLSQEIALEIEGVE